MIRFALASLLFLLPSAVRAYDGPMTLAITWQPAFCEGRSRLPECRSQRAGRFDTQNFTLHGLWPGPRGVEYCGCPPTSAVWTSVASGAGWRGLGYGRICASGFTRRCPACAPACTATNGPSTAPATAAAGATAISRIRWRCSTRVNGSSVRDLFARSIGRRITARAVRDAVSRDFGPAVAQRVELRCRRDGARELITELRFRLQGPVSDTPRLERLASRGQRAGRGCDGGIVDPVGSAVNCFSSSPCIRAALLRP